ncbi:MAG: hypothetical protein Q7S70_01990 [bacterium]|nr:hypothetical protein [bacterium]
MGFSFTGIVYFLEFLATGLLVFRLFQYQRREKTLFAKYFFYFASIFGLFLFITAMGSLFFAENQQVLRGVVISAALLQGLACAILGYLITYISFPRISPWIGFGIVLALALASVIFSLVTPFAPFSELNGNFKVINWDTQPTADILRFSLFLITFFPIMIIFFKRGLAAQDKELKTKTLGFSMIFFFGLVSTLLDFFLNRYFDIGAISNNIAILFLAISTFLTVIFTQKPPPPLYVSKIQ